MLGDALSAGSVAHIADAAVSLVTFKLSPRLPLEELISTRLPLV